MKSLRELDEVHNYQTDKLGRHGSPHDYCESYERHFGPFREKKITFLEIGVQRGDSLRMWRDYFTKATIIGVDKDEPTLWQPKRGDLHLEFIKADIMDDGVLGQLANLKPDIVLDDGSHLSTEMVVACGELIESTGIMYVVEDLGTQYDPRFTDAEPFTDVVKRMCDLIAIRTSRLRICWEPGIVFIYKPGG